MNHKQYLALAVPLIISTITTPLLGAVDTAVAGQLSSPAYIGGVAVGTMILIRCIGSSVFAGKHIRIRRSVTRLPNRSESVLALARPVCIALFAGLMFIILQNRLNTQR
ncbi:hypothetical protein PO124_29395 [Bacillus licheniformis]|nr:hypothetical protein [Bacillus licheniformis]